MKKIFLILTIITTIVFTSSLQHNNLSAYSPNPNHRFSFDKSGSYDESTAYTPLHNLMGMGQNAEFDVTPNTYNGADLWLWHPSSHPDGPFKPMDRVEKISNKSFFSSSSEQIAKANVMKFSDFISKYSKFYPHMVIEVKNFGGKHYLLDKFINIVKPVKSKIEIQSFSDVDLQYLKTKGFDQLDLLVKDSLNKYTQRKLDVWKNMGINRLLIQESIFDNLKKIWKLNLNWKSFDVGFWTVNSDTSKQKFQQFVNSYGSNFKSCYYISDNNTDPLSTRISEFVDLVRQKYKNDNDIFNYLLKIRTYKDGLYLFDDASYNVWKNDFTNHELVNDNKYNKDDEINWFNKQYFGLYNYKKSDFLKRQMPNILKVHGMLDQFIWRESIPNIAKLERKNEGLDIINTRKIWTTNWKKEKSKRFSDTKYLFEDVRKYGEWKKSMSNIDLVTSWFAKQNFGIYKYKKNIFYNNVIKNIGWVYGITNVSSWESSVLKKAVLERKYEARTIINSKKHWSKRTKKVKYNQFVKYSSNYSRLSKYLSWKKKLAKIR